MIDTPLKTKRVGDKEFHPRRISEKSVAFEILRYAAAGTIIVGITGIFAVAPGLAYVGKLFVKKDDRRSYRNKRKRIQETMHRLEKRRLIRLVPEKRGIAVEITDLGKQTFIYSHRSALRPTKRKRWDGIWHIVLFDIPENKRRARDAFRDMLRDIGFFGLQKSAFATPYLCKKEIETISEFHDIGPFVTYLEARTLGRQDREARSYFGLR